MGGSSFGQRALLCKPIPRAGATGRCRIAIATMGDDRTRRRESSEAPPPAAALVLLQVAGPGAPRSFALTGGEHVLGRDPQAEIRIESDDVSRKHAKIVVGRGALISVLDLGST